MIYTEIKNDIIKTLLYITICTLLKVSLFNSIISVCHDILYTNDTLKKNST